MMLAWLLAVAHASCTFDASNDLLGKALEAAEGAYVSLDVDEFQRAMTEVDFMVPCLVEPVAPEVAARLHRIRGLGQFIDGNEEGTLASLSAARRLEPSYTFPEEVLPTGMELRTLYESLPTEGDEGVRLPRPRGGRLLIDGEPSTRRPTASATLLQVDDPHSGLQSQYLAPADPTPFYPGVHKTRTTLLLTGATTATGAAVLYGAAWSSRARLDQATDNDDLLARQATTNALVGGATGLAFAAVVQAGLGLWLDPQR